MTEETRALGIPDHDLKRALTLVRNLRAQALKEGLDPRATRIALIYANLCDRHFAHKILNHVQLAELETIARHLYEKVAFNK